MSDDDSGRGTLARDLQTMIARMDRRRVLRLLAFGSLVPAFGCGDDSGIVTGSGGGGTGGTGTGGSGAGGSGGSMGTTGSKSCAPTPEETPGPYPGDGTNGANALTLTGIVRSDITTSVAGSSGVAAGVALTLHMIVVDNTFSCAPLAGHAIYVWQCDRDGNYSMYPGGASGENYLRGVQVTDAAGRATFQSIFPGCYAGRWPHIHVEIYSSLASATSGANKVFVSQFALPEAICNEAYATAGYEASATHLAQLGLETDSVFKDGSSLQEVEVTGSSAAGYTTSMFASISG